MGAALEPEQRTRGGEIAQRPNENINDQPSNTSNKTFQLHNLKHYKRWLLVAGYIFLILVCQTTAILLGRLYFNKGGNSKWMGTLVQTAGFPILLPLLLLFRKPEPSLANHPCASTLNLSLLYFTLGVLIIGDNLMYTYGLAYLPVSTYSLLCATQLAFNAVTSFFINSQKFTSLIVNSIVLLTIAACLLAINANNEHNNNNVSRTKFMVGFLCTIGASAMYSFILSVIQFSFEHVIKDKTFHNVVAMQVYPSLVATCGCVMGLFASGEWRNIKEEVRGFEIGKVSYIMTLVWTAISWQIYVVGLYGLIYEISSLFSNVISTLGMPLVPVFAVVFFHDKMNGVKVIALVLAMWGFFSYIYQHYLDGTKVGEKAINEDSVNEGHGGHVVESCNK